jgi:hypothetical protein
MADPARRAKILRDLPEDFIPNHDAQSVPQANERAAPNPSHFGWVALRGVTAKSPLRSSPVVSKARASRCKGAVASLEANVLSGQSL